MTDLPRIKREVKSRSQVRNDEKETFQVGIALQALASARFALLFVSGRVANDESKAIRTIMTRLVRRYPGAGDVVPGFIGDDVE